MVHSVGGVLLVMVVVILAEVCFVDVGNVNLLLERVWLRSSLLLLFRFPFLLLEVCL